MLKMNFCRPTGDVFRVLCLGAHSDDIEIGCGGSILTQLDRFENVSIRWVVFSATKERSEEAKP